MDKYFKLKKNYIEDNKIENSTPDKSVFPNNSKTFSKLSDYFTEKAKVKVKTPKIEYNKTFNILEMKSNKLCGLTQNNFYNTKKYIKERAENDISSIFVENITVNSWNDN